MEKEFWIPMKEQTKINAEKNKLIFRLPRLIFMPLIHSNDKK